MLIETVGTSLVVGKLRKGKISNLKDAELDKWYLFVGAFALEYLTVKMASKGISFFINNILIIHFFIYLLLFVGLYCNRKQLAFKVVFIGIFLNFIVIMANGGHMPISPDTMAAAGMADNIAAIKSGSFITHSLLDSHTRLPFLADILALPKPYPRPKVFSIGDVIMAVGIFMFIQQAMIKGLFAMKENKAEL